MNINNVTLVGRVGKDPEIKSVGENNLAKFSLATSRSWKNKKTNEWEQDTQWHNIEGWGYVAEKVERSIFKGSLVAVTGSIKYSKYTGDDGIEKYFTSINADKVEVYKEKESQSDSGGTDPF